MKTRFALIVGAIALLATGCASKTPAQMDMMSAEELVQRAQEASDRYQYRTALQYYETVQERFANNAEMVCTAEYEIAYIHYRQKKYTLAREKFGALLLRYEGPDAELLPQKFKVLAETVLSRMPGAVNSSPETENSNSPALTAG